MKQIRCALIAALCVVGLDAGQTPVPRDPALARELRRAMLAAEDGRPLTREQAAPLLSGLTHASAVAQRQAVRALGRLEDPQFAADVVPLLAAGSPEIRAEAANALGQIAARQADLANGPLQERLGVERDEMVRGVLCETLGRLPLANVTQMQRVEAVLAETARAAQSAANRARAVKGLEVLMRRGWSKQFRAAPATLDVLTGLAIPSSGAGSISEQAPVRRLALLALAAGRILGAVHVTALGDPDPQVRRLAIVALLPDLSFGRRTVMVERALKDTDAMVRYEAVRVHARHLATASCAVEVAALEDPNPHVRLVAIDQLGLSANCPDETSTTSALIAQAQRRGTKSLSAVAADGQRAVNGSASRSAQSSPGAPAIQDWQTPAHAIVSLARRAPAEAKLLLSGFVTDPVWQVRMYAARAADVLGETAALTTLSSDANANVREVALPALVRVKGREADEVLLSALGQPSYQVVLQAARDLKGTPRRDEATQKLLDTLATITATRRETSRDPRLAILDRIQELGYSHQAPAIERYLNDFDPAVARRAADILTAWTGRRWDPLPRRTAGAPAPTPEEIDALPAGFRVTLTGGRSFDVRFYVDEAPITAWRVMRLVKTGYYNGLTFHRIIPGFIIQGGSPDANEFVGDGPFMRDELGLPTNARGTVGTSTRGRDTGDAQVYVNTVDNPRLDHDYTVFGEITRGMDVVDGILEGETIEKIEPISKPVTRR